MFLAWIALGIGAVAMAIVGYLTLWIYHESPATPEMREVAMYIRNGAKTFLKRQYRTVLLFVVVLSLPIGLVFSSVEVVVSFYGWAALLSLVAAYVGMNVAVRANVRTVRAALENRAKAFTLAFRGGSVMGLSVVGRARYMNHLYLSLDICNYHFPL